jgi:aspartate aminotransferase
MAGVVALQEGEPFIKQSVARYKASLDLLLPFLGNLPRVHCPIPDAAFYTFFAVDGMTDSLSYAKEILAKTGIGLAPGRAFGPEGEGYLRLCYAQEPALLQKALDRLKPMLR